RSSKAAMIAAPESSGLLSDLVTTIEPYDGTLRAYVDDANIQSLRKRAVKAKVIRTDFSTDTKTPAYKVKLQNRTNNVDLAQTMYFFEGPGNKKIVITCTAPAQFEAQLEPLFDGCMKTFALSTRWLFWPNSQRVDNAKVFMQPSKSGRSEEHTSELQPPDHLVCRLLLDRK